MALVKVALLSMFLGVMLMASKSMWKQYNELFTSINLNYCFSPPQTTLMVVFYQTESFF
jgi:hypothetical protein